MVEAIMATFNETLSKSYKHLEVSMVMEWSDKFNILQNVVEKFKGERLTIHNITM